MNEGCAGSGDLLFTMDARQSRPYSAQQIGEGFRAVNLARALGRSRPSYEFAKLSCFLRRFAAGAVRWLSAK
jgi:hypothetical protein